MLPLAKHLEAPRYAAFLLRVWQSPGSDTFRIVVEQACRPGLFGFDSWAACELHLLACIDSPSRATAPSAARIMGADAEKRGPRT